jgi:hypothetical protein
VEVTVTDPTPTPATLNKGTHTDLQPGMIIFTGKHYSTINDTAAKPRPNADGKNGIPGDREIRSR